MRAQGLVDRAPRRRRLDVASSVCGLRAQVMSSAEPTLWARGGAAAEAERLAEFVGGEPAVTFA